MSYLAQFAIGVGLFAFSLASTLVWKRRFTPSFATFLPILIIVFVLTAYLLSLETFPIWLDLALPLLVFAVPALILVPVTRSMKRLRNAGKRLYVFDVRRKEPQKLAILTFMGLGLMLWVGPKRGI